MLQGDGVTMIALGVSNDTPPNTNQPKLADGIHLRAMFARDLGFPWYGFYVFRRETGAGTPLCLGASIGKLPVGPMTTATLDTPLGRVSSEAALAVRDDFPARGRAELDLDNRRTLRIDLKEPAWRVTAAIGMRGVVTMHNEIASFLGGLPAGHSLANPLDWHPGLRLVSFEAKGTQSPGMKTAGPPSAHIPSQGLLFGAKLVISMPPSARDVVVELIRATGATTSVTAFDPAGQPVAMKPDDSPSFAGPVARLEITGPPQMVTLQRVLYAIPGPAPAVEVRLTAYAGNAAVSEQRVSGSPGQIINAAFEFDGIGRIDIAGASAALVDLCAVSVTQGANVGWVELPKLPNPIGLPVVHASYPLSAANAASATTLALNRVRYGPATRWQGTPLQELQAQLAEMVKGGPSGTPMAKQKSAVTDTSGAFDAPTMPALAPLDLVLLGALHPALAQMVGLYVVDDAPADKSFDYLLVADYSGAGQKDPKKILALVQANDFSRIDAFIVFNKRRAPAPPLAPPKNLNAFALPGMTVTNAAGALIDATNNVGLNWDAGRSSTNDLLPGKPILHHLWRAGLGNGATPQPATSFAWITGPENPGDANDPDNPVFVTTPRLPGGMKPERRPGWPPPQTPLHYIDRALADGWYAYKANGIDIFGRHSVESAPVTIRVRDTLPPPPPTAVEASVLDHADPSLIKDQPYKAWRATQSQSVGLRVRWSWMMAHQRQAPDTKEFRIYFHPGSELPAPDARATTTWQTRYFVVGYDEFVTKGFMPARDGNGTAYGGTVTNVSGNRLTLQSTAPLAELSLLGAHIVVGSAPAIPILAATANTVLVPSAAGITVGATWDIRYPVRVYDVFIPKAGDPPADVPLVPNLQDPLLYAHVGVTAVDDKTTSDHPKWVSGKFGNRPGNESAVSAPAKVFRVLRKAPDPPQPVGGDARVYTTRANLDGESFYTHRWSKQASLKTHIFRALFDSVVQTDWRIHTTRKALDPGTSAHADLFPKDWDLARKKTAAQALNAIASKTTYATLSPDAKRLLNALPGNVSPGVDPADADWRIRSTRKQLSANDLDYFPTSAHWDATRRQAVAAALNAIQKLADYESLSDDALRILAGLPGIELAFSQITIQPLGDDRVDARGPDDPANYVPSSQLLAYRDTLPGLTAGRYFYRSALVTGAHNISRLGLSGPPVYVPNVRRPRAPVLVSVTGGDRAITLLWRQSKGVALKERRVYRATSEAAAVDLRDMQLVATLSPADLQWKDTAVIPMQTHFYRLTAVDPDGLESLPTPPAAARAFDDARPAPPTWASAQTTTSGIALKWTAPVADLRCLVQRKRVGETAWTSLTAWLKPGVYQSRDDAREAGKQYTYRLLVRDSAEHQNRTFNELTV